MISQKVPKEEKHWNPLGPKQKSALGLYDDLREKAGLGAWEIVYHSKNGGASELFGFGICLASVLPLLGPLAGVANQSSSVQVQSRKATHIDVRIPHFDLSPPSSTDKEGREDWETSFDEFQEWLGLACIGSQR